MMTLQSVSAAQAGSYYEKDDYYTEAGLMPAQWGGKLAAQLGLSGEFDQKKFSNALRGEFDGHEFKQKPSPKRAALDACLSAPKSVSIMALVAGDKRIIEAHDRAVQAAMARLEGLALTRVTENGETRSMPVSGIAYASFRHDTSRLGDPNLHTHNTIFKAVMGPDGKLLSLDNKEMFRAQREMDATYKAALAADLRAMGYGLVMTRDGFEIEGVSGQLIAEMSQRAQQIEAKLAANGLDRESASGPQRKAANLSTRDSKKIYNREALAKWWNDRVQFLAKVLGVTPESLFAKVPGESHQAETQPHQPKELEHEQVNADHPELGSEPPPFRRNRMHEVSELDVVHDARRAQVLLPSDVLADLDNEAAERDSGVQRDRDRAGERDNARAEPGPAHTGERSTVARAHDTGAAAEIGGGLHDRLSADGALASALEHIMERESVIKNRHVLVAEAIQASEYRVTAEQIDAAIDAWIASGEIIVNDAGRMTTRQAVEAEKAVNAAYETGRGVCAPIADVALVSKTLTTIEAKLGGQMTRGQRAMVENITMGTHRVMVVEGDAGTGKSTGMEAVKAIAEARGLTVLGLAPSAQAKEALEQAGLETITSQRGKVDNKFWERVNSKTLIVLDEAGLVDVRTMRTILERLAERGARIVVTGDDKQFASVEAGRALYQLNELAKRHGENIRLDEMRRGKTKEEISVLPFSLGNPVDMRTLHFAARDNPVEALDQLFAAGQAYVSQNDKRRIAAIAKAYLATPEVVTDERGRTERLRDSTLVLTGKNVDRIAINAAIREALGRSGGTEIDTFERFDFSKAQARQLAYYEVGNIVRFNAATDDFRKGEMLRVVEKAHDKLVLARADGSRVDFHPHRQAQSVTVGSEERIALTQGERIRFTANDDSKDKRFVNGDRGTLVAIEKDRIKIRLDKGSEVSIQRDGKTPLPLRYGYCQTGHSAQGATAKNVLMHLKSTDGTVDLKSFYTNLTRAAVNIRVFTDAFEGKRFAALRQAISFAKNKELALEVTGEARQARAEQEQGQEQEQQKKHERLTYIGPARGWQREKLAQGADAAAIEAGLRRAMERFGAKLHIEGDKAFKDRVAEVIVKQGLDVKCNDKAINDKIESMRERAQQRRENVAAGVVASKPEAKQAAKTQEQAEKEQKPATKPAWRERLAQMGDQAREEKEQKRKEEQEKEHQRKHRHDFDHGL